MSIEVPVTPRRVKVYELQLESWHDRGTGFCTGEIINDDAYILVKSEDDADRSLLETRIYRDVQYQKQQDTLIVWTDQDETDLALSFQEGDGCSVIWDFITDVQKHLGLNDNQSDDVHDFLSGSIDLPTEPSLGCLNEVERSLAIASHTQYGRDSVTRYIQEVDYIGKLIPLLDIAEDLESLSDLHSLCRIMKLIILMNDNMIVEQILLDEYILGVVGMLEYDPEFPKFKANHREYIADNSRFKQVVPIPDESIRNKIKYTFRLQYLKDVVLARLLDDPTFSMLSSMIYFYQVDIINYLQHNDEFTTALFKIFDMPDNLEISNDDDEPLIKKRDAVRFIHQFCLISKNLQVQQRSSLYTNFINKNLFNVINFALTDSIPVVRIAGVELILSIIDHDPSLVRSAVLKTAGDDSTVIDTIINLLLTESDFGVISQVSEALQVLLDPSSGQPIDVLRKTPDILLRHGSDDPEIEMFLDSFYNKSVRRLFQKLSSFTENNINVKNLSPSEAALYSSLCDIVCRFVKLHGYRSRSFLVESNVLTNVSQLFASYNKALKLSALRCFRQCLASNDEFYCRFLVKNRLITPIVKLFLEVGDKNNLINSACLEFFEFIRSGSFKPDYQRNMKLIVDHVVSLHRKEIEVLAKFDTIRNLIARYDQLHEESSDGPKQDESAAKMQIQANGRWNSLREMELDEEEYFNTSDDDDNNIEGDASTGAAENILEEVKSISSEDKSSVAVKNKDAVSDRLTDDSTESIEEPVLNSTIKQSATENSLPVDLESGSLPCLDTSTSDTTRLKLLGEKRRRDGDERDDDDELDKLSTMKKKKSSSPGGHFSNNSAKRFLSSTTKKIAIALGPKRLKDRDSSSK
ncbi:component of IIS longevity pathway SMK-1-domain-containing protein [Dipodascopsis uninucleata]